MFGINCYNSHAHKEAVSASFRLGVAGGFTDFLLFENPTLGEMNKAYCHIIPSNIDDFYIMNRVHLYHTDLKIFKEYA